jgi:hypothetical protein
LAWFAGAVHYSETILAKVFVKGDENSKLVSYIVWKRHAAEVLAGFLKLDREIKISSTYFCTLVET